MWSKQLSKRPNSFLPSHSKLCQRNQLWARLQAQSGAPDWLRGVLSAPTTCMHMLKKCFHQLHIHYLCVWFYLPLHSLLVIQDSFEGIFFWKSQRREQFPVTFQMLKWSHAPFHMVDQYDQLYSKRFGVFWSEVSENKLREISLNHAVTFEKLRQHGHATPRTSRSSICLCQSGVPDAVFDPHRPGCAKTWADSRS